MELLVVLALFALLALLGPWVGVDSRVPGGWTPTEPEGKIWPDRPVMPDRSVDLRQPATVVGRETSRSGH